MTKQIITKKATDNNYLHMDFHIAFNYSIDYLYGNFGVDSVKEYLTKFASAYYSPLKEAICNKGLLAIKKHYEKIYNLEGAEFDISYSQDELILNLIASPAVVYIKKNGHSPSIAYRETVETVNKEICRGTPFQCEMMDYENENGSYQLRFFRGGK